MWWQIVPSFLIVTAGVAGPGYLTYALYYLVLGNCHRRSLADPWDRHMYFRDRRVTGDPYVVTKLDDFDFDTEKQDEKKK